MIIFAAKKRIARYSRTVQRNLDKCTAQDKKKALSALNVRITAIPEKLEITVAVHSIFITIEQTSGCIVDKTAIQE